MSTPTRPPLNLKFIKQLFSTWYWWGFVILWVIAGETESFSSNTLLALYMKAHPTIHYSVTQLNNYPHRRSSRGHHINSLLGLVN